MANMILEQMAKKSPTANTNNPMLQQLVNFKNSYRGDPKQAVMQMLRSGQINEAQLKQAIAQARQLQNLIR